MNSGRKNVTEAFLPAAGREERKESMKQRKEKGQKEYKQRKWVMLGSFVVLIGGSALWLFGTALYHKTLLNGYVMEFMDGELLKQWTFLGMLCGAVLLLTVELAVFSVYCVVRERRFAARALEEESVEQEDFN